MTLTVWMYREEPRMGPCLPEDGRWWNPLPRVDLILCRERLVHMSFEDAFRDSTLCYRRTVWSAQPYSPANHALDCGWLWSGPRKGLRSLDADPLYVGIIHATHTSIKTTHDARWAPALIEVVGTDLHRYLTGAWR